MEEDIVGVFRCIKFVYWLVVSSYGYLFFVRVFKNGWFGVYDKWVEVFYILCFVEWLEFKVSWEMLKFVIDYLDGFGVWF